MVSHEIHSLSFVHFASWRVCLSADLWWYLFPNFHSFNSQKKFLSLSFTKLLVSTATLITNVCIFTWFSQRSTPPLLLNTPWSSQHTKEFVEHILAVFLRLANAPFANSLCLQYFYGVCKKLCPALPQCIQTAYPVPDPKCKCLSYTVQICLLFIPRVD